MRQILEGILRFWGPGLLSTSPAFSMSSASHSAGSSGWLAPKTGAGPTFQWAGKVDAICRSRSNRTKRPRAGCILRSVKKRVNSVSFVTSKHFRNRLSVFNLDKSEITCWSIGYNIGVVLGGRNLT